MSSGPANPLSPTRRDLSEAEITQYVRDAFGPAAEVVAVIPLPGGGFASVTRIDLADGRSVVLKVGPSPETGILGYEHGVVGAEARYLQLIERHLPGAPFPGLLHHGTDKTPAAPVPADDGRDAQSRDDPGQPDVAIRSPRGDPA
jgi:hypothetical protein